MVTWTEVVALEVIKKWLYFYSGYISKVRQQADGLNITEYKRKKGIENDS